MCPLEQQRKRLGPTRTQNTTMAQHHHFLLFAIRNSVGRGGGRGSLNRVSEAHLDHLWGQVIQSAAQGVPPRVGGVNAPPKVRQLEPSPGPNQQVLGLPTPRGENTRIDNTTPTRQSERARGKSTRSRVRGGCTTTRTPTPPTNNSSTT